MYLHLSYSNDTPHLIQDKVLPHSAECVSNMAAKGAPDMTTVMTGITPSGTVLQLHINLTCQVHIL